MYVCVCERVSRPVLSTLIFDASRGRKYLRCEKIRRRPAPVFPGRLNPD